MAQKNTDTLSGNVSGGNQIDFSPWFASLYMPLLGLPLENAALTPCPLISKY